MDFRTRCLQSWNRVPWPLVLGSWTLILCLDPYYWVYWRLIFCLARSTGVYVCVCLYVCGRAGRRAGVRVICAMYMCARACTCVYIVGGWYCMRYSVLRRVNINVLLNLAVCRVVVSVSGSEPVFISVSYYRSFLLSPLSKSVTFEE